jgi:AcrR family transcriptional regulator
MDMNSRSYSMTTRAASAEATRGSILRATFDLVGEKSNLEIVLADVAARAGVTVKTILRHFGSRDGLFDAVAEFAAREIDEERATPVGDPGRAVTIIVDHYETRGDWVIRMLAQEQTDARIAGLVDRGRRTHRDWVRATFAPQLESVAAPGREAAIDLLVVATDVYTWKILRRDRGLDRSLAERRIRTLVRTVLEGTAEGD